MTELCFSSNTIKNEDQLMPIIIKNLQDNGGELTRRELEDKIANTDDEWNKYVNHTNTSKKRKNDWRPFPFTFNYTLKHLRLAGYLDYKRMTPVKLTAKGIETDLSSFDAKAVRAVSQPIWDAEVERRHAAKERQDANRNEDDEIQQENDDELDNKWRADLKQRLKDMNPYKFEMFCRGLLKKMGITIDEEKGVQKSNDGGIDGFGYSVSSSYRMERVALQCKRFNEGQVGSPCIDALKGAIDSNSAEYGIFITTSSYSKAAIEKAKVGKTPITLIDGDQLIDLIEKYEYRVRKVAYYIPDDDIWNED